VFISGVIINNSSWNSVLSSYEIIGMMMLFGGILSMPAINNTVMNWSCRIIWIFTTSFMIILSVWGFKISENN